MSRRTNEGGSDNPSAAEEVKKKAQSYEEARKHPNEWTSSGPDEGSDKVDLSGIGRLLAGRFPPPDVPANGKQSGGGVRVSTDALKAFAANLRLLLPALRRAKEQIESVKLAPGVFLDAWELRGKVEGVGSNGTAIKLATLRFLEKAIDAITAAAEETEKLAAAYATAEKLNAATSQDLGEHFERTKDRIGSATDRAANG